MYYAGVTAFNGDWLPRADALTQSGPAISFIYKFYIYIMAELPTEASRYEAYVQEHTESGIAEQHNTRQIQL